jgi:RNA polymerase sigma-70 factor (ECF subfamily)
MTELGKNLNLQQVLEQRYDDLRLRLTRKLGSKDRAQEVLHEVWLKLNNADAPHANSAETVRSPVAYLLRMALNLSVDADRKEKRWSSREDVMAELGIRGGADSASDHPWDNRLDVEKLKLVLAELPERQRLILVAARLEELPHWRIAQKFNLSERTVRYELSRALMACRGALNGEDK